MPRLFSSQAEEIVNVRYTSSQTVIFPAGVTKLDRIVGAGGRGQDGTNGYYDPPTTHSTYAASVVGESTSSSNAFPGQLTWEVCQNGHEEAVRKMGPGGSGSWVRRGYNQYTNGWVVTNETMYYFDVIPGTVFAYFSGGWKYSGNVVPGDFAFSYVEWQEYGAYNPGSPPSTGPSATFTGPGASLSFPGSTGNVAPTSTTYTNVAVTAGSQYTLNVPVGGYIEITYTK